MTTMISTDARAPIPPVDHALSSRKDQSYLRLALKLAAQSNERQRHGCVIVRGNSILGIGYNRFRNSPFFIKDAFSWSLHAEARAVAVVSNQELLDGATLFVARINRAGLARYSAPCGQCALLLESVGIKRIVHT
jgi:deoxycytidylate deaminase